MINYNGIRSFRCETEINKGPIIEPWGRPHIMLARKETIIVFYKSGEIALYLFHSQATYAIVFQFTE